MLVFEKEKKYLIYLHLWKLEKIYLLPLSNPNLSSLCNSNVYNLLSDFVYHFSFFFISDWTILSRLVITASTASGPLIYVLM